MGAAGRADSPSARTARRRTLYALALTAALWLLCAPFALANGPQVSVLYPVTGSLTSSPLESPPHHHAGAPQYQGNFALDASAGEGKPVYARFANANGALTLSLGGTFEPCAVARTGGLGLLVNVFLNGTRVGQVAYSHLASVTQSSGSIANGAQIGEIFTGGSKPCWDGEHVHVEPRSVTGAACFISRGLNTPVDTSKFLGVIGGGYANVDNRTCPTGAEWFVGSIVQWRDDPNSQKTSWEVGTDRHRRWVPNVRTYNCLRGRGVADAGGLVASVLDQLADLNGIWAQCPYGDVNYDGKVNIFDLSGLLTAYGRTGAQKADDNYDGAVNIFDLSILLSNYGRTS